MKNIYPDDEWSSICFIFTFLGKHIYQVRQRMWNNAHYCLVLDTVSSNHYMNYSYLIFLIFLLLLFLLLFLPIVIIIAIIIIIIIKFYQSRLNRLIILYKIISTFTAHNPSPYANINISIFSVCVHIIIHMYAPVCLYAYIYVFIASSASNYIISQVTREMLPIYWKHLILNIIHIHDKI